MEFERVVVEWKEMERSENVELVLNWGNFWAFLSLAVEIYVGKAFK